MVECIALCTVGFMNARSRTVVLTVLIFCGREGLTAAVVKYIWVRLMTVAAA